MSLRVSDRIVGLLGRGGMDALNRVFGLLVLAIGMELIIHGIVNHGAVVPLHSP